MQDRAPTLLESWKEIATFIGRDERTAMRWAKDSGMPVHRVPTGKRGHVFAYPVEIRAWLNSAARQEGPVLLPRTRAPGTDVGSLPFESIQTAHATESPATETCAPAPVPGRAFITIGLFGEMHRWFVRYGWKLLIATTSLVTLVWLFTFVSAGVSPSSSLHLVGVTKLTDDFRPKSYLFTDGKILYYTALDGLRPALMALSVEGGTPRKIDTPFPNAMLQDLSGDGQDLLISSFEGLENDKPLWELHLKGGAPRRVGSLKCSLARWSPDRSQIAFVKGDQLWVADAGGTGARRLTSFKGQVGYLLWSPDRTKIRVRVSDHLSVGGELWDVPLTILDGDYPGNPTRVEENSGMTSAVWINRGHDLVSGGDSSKDDSALVVSSESPNRWGLGVRPTRVALNIGSIASLASSGQGRDLYALAKSRTRGELIRIDSHTQTFQTFLGGISAQYVSFSRDSQWITFTDVPTATLWRSRADGSEPLQLTKLPMEVELSSWSPDGSQIAFMGRTPGNPWRIYLVSKNGSNIREASAGTIWQGAPTWSPDGKFIVYGNVYCEEDKSCELRRIEINSGRDEFVPGSQGLHTARWSYDGKHIAAIEPSRYELHVMDTATGRWKLLADNVTGDDLNWSRDSKFLYFENPRGEKPAIERVRLRDGQRSVEVDLTPIQRLSGGLGVWFGLTPDDSPIMFRTLDSIEIYAIHLSDR